MFDTSSWFVTIAFYLVTMILNLLWYFYRGDLLHGKTTYHSKLSTIVTGFTMVETPPWFVTTVFYHVTIVLNLLWYMILPCNKSPWYAEHSNLPRVLQWYFFMRVDLLCHIFCSCMNKFFLFFELQIRINLFL